jgi:hypothetical protein
VTKPARTWEERNRKAQQTRKSRLARILESVPLTLCVDLLKLTVCWRYTESLVANPRVKKYLMKHHPEELRDLETVLAELNEASGDSSPSAKLQMCSPAFLKASHD